MRIGITERGDGGLDQSWRQKMKNVDGAIIITKAPQLLLPDTIPDNVIIHCTITGWGGTKLEPNVETPEETIPAWQTLKEKLGQERVVLRVDPIITECPKRSIEIASNIQDGDRIRISFLDCYPHVRERLCENKINLSQGFHAPIKDRLALLNSLPRQTEICGEPNMPCIGCISNRDLRAIGISYKSSNECGQRLECRCMSEKVELLSSKKQCAHGCLYCYWK